MAPPVLTLDQIKMQLQTQWGGAEEGSRYDWYDGNGQVDGSIYYALPDIAFVRDQQSEEAGFVAMTAIQKAFAREAFELWDDLIASSLIENTDIDGRVPFGFDEQISFGYSSTTERGGSYTRAMGRGRTGRKQHVLSRLRPCEDLDEFILVDADEQ